jgi:pimeloyl-ACP methyl ester carboxylesterase
MGSYVLVHGGHDGAHSFRHVRPLLRAAGHEVFTPALTGIGERSHLLSPQVDLRTHILDVVNLVRYEGLTDVTLLGFSYGGIVVTGALEAVADEVKHLVYLEALVPKDGDSVASLSGRPGWERWPAPGESWFKPVPERHYDDPADAAFEDPRRTPHPLACFTDPVRVARPVDEYPFSRTFIRASGHSSIPTVQAIVDAARYAEQSPAWRYHEIETDHLIPTNRPAELATVLLELT